MNKNTNPLVSVIIPVYNSSEYIGSCIESLLGQTYDNIEILIVNDGSTDDSENVILRYSQSDGRIRYFKKENGGVSKARNYGMSLAEGTYLTFVDSDDWVDADFISQAVDKMERYSLDMVLGGTQRVYPSHRDNLVAGGEEEITIYEENLVLLKQRVLSNGITEDSSINTCFTSGPVCKLFRKSIVESIRFKENLIIGEDTVFNLEALEHIQRAGVVPKIWYYYRMNDASATQRYNPSIYKYTEALMKELAAQYGENPSLQPSLCVRGAQQFYGMLLLGVLNKQETGTFLQKRNYIKKALKRPVWDQIFRHMDVKHLPASRQDKILVWLCKQKSAFLIICFTKLRLFLKGLKQEIKKWKK